MHMWLRQKHRTQSEIPRAPAAPYVLFFAYLRFDRDTYSYSSFRSFFGITCFGHKMLIAVLREKVFRPDRKRSSHVLCVNKWLMHNLHVTAGAAFPSACERCACDRCCSVAFSHILQDIRTSLFCESLDFKIQTWTREEELNFIFVFWIFQSFPCFPEIKPVIKTIRGNQSVATVKLISILELFWRFFLFIRGSHPFPYASDVNAKQNDLWWVIYRSFNALECIFRHSSSVSPSIKHFYFLLFRLHLLDSLLFLVHTRTHTHTPHTSPSSSAITIHFSSTCRSSCVAASVVCGTEIRWRWRTCIQSERRTRHENKKNGRG